MLSAMGEKRVLVAGVGNVLMGDDGFGCEVARLIAARAWPPGVRVLDFGIRGIDLALALSDGWKRAIVVDAMSRGGAPGTLYVLEPSEITPSGPVSTHGNAPHHALALARSMSELPELRIVGCEPATLGTEDEPIHGLSEPVVAALAPAIEAISVLVHGWCDDA